MYMCLNMLSAGVNYLQFINYFLFFNSNSGAGVYACDYRKYYVLEEDEWRFDTIPEFMDGKNMCMCIQIYIYIYVHIYIYS
jgi:hypothetical protein